MTSELMLIIFILYLLLSLALAVAYLLRRRLTPGEWFFWGLVAVFLPVLGPFVVIAARPGLPPLKPRKPTPPQQGKTQ
jgi:membrane-bound metal-dependent hydrolase YbcI (DUF457 family)